MDIINGQTNKLGSGKTNQLEQVNYLVEQVQLITNDVRMLSHINLVTGVEALLAILRSRKEEASALLDELTVIEITDLRRAAVDLAMMCNKKILDETNG